MRPERENSLVEILDKLMNRGAVLNADLIITVAGIPLMGLQLRAIIASMETMLQYGIMEDWDRSTREWYARQNRRPPVDEGEEILFKSPGRMLAEARPEGRQEEGRPEGSWSPGFWLITNRRLFLWRREPDEISLEIPLRYIESLSRAGDTSLDGSNLMLRYTGGSAIISIADTDGFGRSLEEAVGKGLWMALMHP